MRLDILTLDGSTSGAVVLPEDIFGLEPRKDILHRVVQWQLNKARAGNRRTLTRAEVRGANQKIVRQKGSGGARHGNRKVPQYRSGAKAHGPVVREHTTDLPKKVRRLGLKIALSAKARANELVLLDGAALDAPKTKTLKAALDKLNLKSVLVIDGPEVDANFKMAAQNIPCVDILPVQGANVRDILRRETLVLTKAAVEHLQARLA